jgi:uncharacterized protein YprB with RNaseH-like and TPR domain
VRLENTFILFPGIGEKTEKKLWNDGIRHWDHLEDSSKYSDKIHEQREKARKNLRVGNELFFKDKLPNKSLWRAYRNFRENICFFDIETTGLKPERNKTTTVSFYRNGESKTLIRGKDLTQEKLQEEIFQSSMLVSFNGKRFDQPFLEKNFDLNIETPHVDLMYLFKRIGYSGGLKKIEKELGVDRELEDIDGRGAIRLWKRYEKEGNEEALQKLVRYNQYDAENLQDLMEIAREKLIGKIADEPERFKANT